MGVLKKTESKKFFRGIVDIHTVNIPNFEKGEGVLFKNSLRIICMGVIFSLYLPMDKCVLKTSEDWKKEDISGTIVLDPDGWDRSSYQFSFYEELITEEDYNMRKMMSTCMFNSKKKSFDCL